MRTSSRFKQNITKFILDLTIFIGFLLVLDPRTTGIAIHEWLAIAIAATIVIHLLLNWNWVVEVTRRLFGKTSWRARINYILNWLFFINVVLIILTGIMISNAVLPSLGIQLARNAYWSRLHALTTDLSIFMLGLHVALHWNWIVKMVNIFIIQPVASLRLRKGVKQKQGTEVEA
jgi:hypothetical protein